MMAAAKTTGAGKGGKGGKLGSGKLGGKGGKVGGKLGGKVGGKVSGKIGGGKGKTSGKKAPMSKSARAGLILPVGRIYQMLKSYNEKTHVATGAAVVLAAVLEYILAEVLELAGQIARHSDQKRVNPNHVMFAVRGDDELAHFLQCEIRHSSFVPFEAPIVTTAKGKKVDVNLLFANMENRYKRFLPTQTPAPEN